VILALQAKLGIGADMPGGAAQALWSDAAGASLWRAIMAVHRQFGSYLNNSVLTWFLILTLTDGDQGGSKSGNAQIQR
jgi:hypothetical protein